MSEPEDFKDTPGDWARRWTLEFNAAKKAVEKWHKSGGKVVERFLDERDTSTSADTRFNYFWANITTQRAMLFGQTPKVSVDRRHADSGDDVARVAGEMLERLLNTDIEGESDGFATALQCALDDRTLPGLGFLRLRYVAEFEMVPEVLAQVGPDGVELAPAVPCVERKTSEQVESDYVHWRDVLWSPCRVFHEARWFAFRAKMPRAALLARFGQEVGRAVPLNTKKSEQDGEVNDPRGRADVWEVWSKEHRRVFWFVEGYGAVLDQRADPLGLKGFWPFPRPMMANITTSAFMPRPDYALAQDIYTEIDSVSTRITLLERAIRVAGVYDKGSPEVQRLLTDSPNSNKLYPVENWAAFAEKGGVNGQIAWMPLEQIVSALGVLRDYRRELVDSLFQITGMSDIMRGQAASTSTATEQAIKAKFGSVRMQSAQDEFARFASDAQALKAEIIAKHFDPETIVARSNMASGPDALLAQQAVALLKSESAQYRIQVKPEAVSLTDFAALKQERAEVIVSLSSFLQAAAPLAQQMPGSLPYLLQMLQWSVSGLRGASQIEGVLDQAIVAAQNAPPAQSQQQPDPKLAQIQLKGQVDMQKAQMDSQLDVQRLQAEVMAEEGKQKAQTEWNLREARAKEAMKLTLPVDPRGAL